MKKILNLIVIICLSFVLFSCKDKIVQLESTDKATVSSEYQLNWNKVENAEYYEVRINKETLQVVDNHLNVLPYLMDGNNVVVITSKSFNELYTDSIPYVTTFIYEAIQEEEFSYDIQTLLLEYIHLDEAVASNFTQVFETACKNSKITNKQAYELIDVIIKLLVDKEDRLSNLENLKNIGISKKIITEYLYHIIIELVLSNVTENKSTIAFLLNNVDSPIEDLLSKCYDNFHLAYDDIYLAVDTYLNSNDTTKDKVDYYNSFIDIIFRKYPLNNDDMSAVIKIIQVFSTLTQSIESDTIRRIVNILINVVTLYLENISSTNVLLYSRLYINEGGPLYYLISLDYASLDMDNIEEAIIEFIDSFNNNLNEQEIEAYKDITQSIAFEELVLSILELFDYHEVSLNEEARSLIDNFEYENKLSLYILIIDILKLYGVSLEQLEYIIDDYVDQEVIKNINYDTASDYYNKYQKYNDLFNQEEVTYLEVITLLLNDMEMNQFFDTYKEELITYLNEHDPNTTINEDVRVLIQRELNKIIDACTPYLE